MLPTRSYQQVALLAPMIMLAGSQALLPAQEPANDAKTQTALKEFFQDDFKVGVAVNRSITTGQAFRRSAQKVASDIAQTKHHFNHVVAENDMKWQLIHPRPGADGFDFAPADALIEFASSNKMEVAGHTLVWHSQTPNWVFEGSHLPEDASSDQASSKVNQSDSHQLTISPPIAPNGAAPPGFGGFRSFDLNGPRASREELLERMREHIHAVVGRYKGKVKVWDVVNEALSDSGPDVLRRTPWSVIIGPDFVAKAFEYAHEADPDAVLRYNDYGLEKPEKRSKLIKLIQNLQAQKIPIGAIGSQAHCNVSTSFESMDQSLTEIASLGLPIHITELDVNSATAGQRSTSADVGANAATTQGGLVADADKRLAEAYAGLFRAFLKHKDVIEVVTFWGVNDELSWRAQGKPLLFDGNNQAKQAFNAVIQIRRQQMWIDRTVETTLAIVSDPDRPGYDKDFSVGMAGLALGQTGCLKEALKLFDHPAFAKGSKIRHEGLLSLADGLSSADRVDDALKIVGLIENEYMRGTAFSLVAIRQSQRGDFADAENLLNQIPDQVYRDRAVKQICSEYAKVRRFDDASRLSATMSDPAGLSEAKKEIANKSRRPSVTDAGYVEFQLDTARNGTFGSASESELRFLNHYYHAEVAFELKDQTQFDTETLAARQVVEAMKENDGSLLLLGRLLYRAEKRDDAKSLYAVLFRNYSTESDANPFDFNKMLFGSGPNSDASILAECMSDKEAKRTLESLLKLESATTVAAPIFGAVVSRKDPSWADDLYNTTADLVVKNSLAINCVLATAK